MPPDRGVTHGRVVVVVLLGAVILAAMSDTVDDEGVAC